MYPLLFTVNKNKKKKEKRKKNGETTFLSFSFSPSLTLPPRSRRQCHLVESYEETKQRGLNGVTPWKCAGKNSCQNHWLHVRHSPLRLQIPLLFQIPHLWSVNFLFSIYFIKSVWLLRKWICIRLTTLCSDFNNKFPCLHVFFQERSRLRMRVPFQQRPNYQNNQNHLRCMKETERKWRK